MDKSNNSADRFKEVRKLLGLTQQGLADELLLSRNYIAKIEAGIQEPSPRALMALESARVRLINTSGALRDTAEMAVAEDQAPYGDNKMLAQEIERRVAELLALAGDDHERLHWIIVQMKEHLTAPKTWRPTRAKFRYVTLPSQTQALSTETGKPVSRPGGADLSA